MLLLLIIWRFNGVRNPAWHARLVYAFFSTGSIVLITGLMFLHQIE